MLAKLAVFLMAMLAVPQAHAADAKADRVIARAVAAMGGIDAFRARTSLVFRGVHYEGAYHQEFATGGRGRAVMTRMRPNLRIVGCVPGIPGCEGKWGNIVESYDGSSGWELNWPRQRLVHAVNKAESALVCGAQFDPLYVDYKARGMSAAYLGSQKLLGRSTVAVRIDNPGCPSEIFYFDAKSYRLTMHRASLPVHARGDAVDMVEVVSDLRPVAGVLTPFRAEEVAVGDGHVIGGAQWLSIEANTVSDAAVQGARGPSHRRDGPGAADARSRAACWGGYCRNVRQLAGDAGRCRRRHAVRHELARL